MLEFYLDKTNNQNRRNNRIFVVEEGSHRTKVLLDAKLWQGVGVVGFSRARYGTGRLGACYVQ